MFYFINFYILKLKIEIIYNERIIANLKLHYLPYACSITQYNIKKILFFCW